MRIRPAILLLTTCLPAGDRARVGYHPLLQRLRVDAHPSALPRGYTRPESVWSADSPTDSITVVARIEMSTLVARVDRSDDCGLRGHMRLSGEGAGASEHATTAAQRTLPDLVEWRPVPCRTLRLDRAHAINRHHRAAPRSSSVAARTPHRSSPAVRPHAPRGTPSSGRPP